MIVTSLTTAKNQFNGLIDQVKQGETIVITEGGKPVAQIEPVNILGPIFDTIHASGLLKLPVGKLDLTAFISASRPAITSGNSLATSIIEERENNR